MLLPQEIDIETTLFSGQTFAWHKAPGGIAGCVDGKSAYLPAGSRELIVGQGTEAFWQRYFDIGRDYAAVFAPFSADPYITQAFAAYGGMRILNQPVWETLCSFIISANNNIKRIGGIVARLCERLGGPLSAGPETVYSFPHPQAILDAGVSELYGLGLGYRAPYLYGSARAVADGLDLAALSQIGYERALKELLRLPGVGEKVADCVLLFSCGYACALPVDVWVKRVMRMLYGAEGTNPRIKARGQELFGVNAGLVQQILFHAARMGAFPELCQKEPSICADTCALEV